jgi:hypothetical protein
MSNPDVRRRLALIAGASIAANLLGCGGGGDDAPAPASSPSPSTAPPAGQVPGGAFGGGQGKLALMKTTSQAATLDLGTRLVLGNLGLGLGSSVFGLTSTSSGTLALVAREGFKFSADIRVLRSDLSVLHQYTVPLGVGTPRSAAAISPDGQRLALGVNVAETGQTGTFWYVLIANVDGTGQTFVPLGRKVGSVISERANPVWLPDGRLLVQTDQGIYRSDDAAAGKFSLLLAREFDAPNRTTLSPSGGVLYFDQGTVSGSGSRLWSFDLAAGQARQLAQGNFEQYCCAVSPDGAWLLFQDNQAALFNGVPSSELRSYFLSAIPTNSNLLDLATRDAKLRDSSGAAFTVESTRIAWY